MQPFQTVQTLHTIQRVAPFVFKVRKYYGDGRRQTSAAGEKHIQVNLTKDHEIFDGREANANVIVFCSYQTWNERNGPKGQNKWLRNKRRFTSDQIKEREGNLDPQWPGALPKCFELAVCDEAQEHKSLQTKGNHAVSWLVVDFHLLITATPVSYIRSSTKYVYIYVSKQKRSHLRKDSGNKRMRPLRILANREAFKADSSSNAVARTTQGGANSLTVGNCNILP